MKKIITIIICICAFVYLVGCADLSLPLYERVDSEEDGIAVMVDGVKYVTYPELNWNVRPDSTIIGYAGTRGTAVLGAEGDTEKNFLFLCDSGFSGAYFSPLHRTDKTIPEPSSASVDELIYSEYDMRVDKTYSNTIKDKEVIKQYYNALGSINTITEAEIIKDYSISIGSYSSEVPGAISVLYINKSDGKLFICISNNSYVEMPIELLEKISGHKIDIEYLLQE